MSADASAAPTPTLREVRAALWETLGQIKRGTMKHDVGQVLINGYGSMFKMLVDQRDSKWTKRVEQMWNERQSHDAAEPEANH